ncbi:translation elongation factor Ts [bacterium]|nr:translation elongation factor Ts [bacterium]
MTEISAQLVRELRDKTNAGMMDCKKALQESSGDLDKAIEYLRKKGLKDISKRATKDAREGTVHTYLHTGGRVGVMLELNCETDFVARNAEFTELANAVAMHVAWAKPRFLDRESVPANVIAKESEIFRSQLKPEQEKMADKIVTGRLEKFFTENCLVEQLDARDPQGKRTIGSMLNEHSAKVGEKVVLRRFIRFELGEELEATTGEKSSAQ